MSIEFRDAFAVLLEEALLHASDGTVRLHEETLKHFADEILYNDLIAGGIERSLAADSVAFHFAQAQIPASKRRAAPTVDEAWATRPEIKERDDESNSDPEYQKFVRVPQPLYSPDTPFEELPQTIVRACCPGKTCGPVTLTKFTFEGRRSAGFYARDLEKAQGDEHYFDYGTNTEGLIAALNNPEFWPNRWLDQVFVFARDEPGIDMNEPGDLHFDE